MINDIKTTKGEKVMVHQVRLSRPNKMKEKVMQGILYLRLYIQRLYWLFAATCLVAPVDVAIGDDVDWRYRADAWGNEMGAWIYVNPKTDALTDRWCAVPKGDVTIPSSINTLPVYGIDSRAFEGCTNITSVIMPNSIVNMGSGAFERCFKLKSVSFSANLTDISGAAFSHCTNLQYITLPTRVTSIGASAFSYCSNLSHIDMSNVSRIDEWAFEGCRSLTSIDFPPTLKYVHNWAFRDATNLTRIAISDLSKFCKITSDRDRIPYQGEYSRPSLYINDMQLTDIVIPEGTTSIADWSLFAWCSGLRSVIIPDSVTYVGKYAFRSTDLESVVMGNGVDEIGDMAFYGCTKLTNVVMRSGVKRIGNNCFQDGRFKEFTIGSNVEKIGSNVFNGCSELETIIFPSTVTNIGSHIFSACFKLSAIYLPTNYTGNTSKTIGSTFESKIIRYVPEQRITLNAHGGSVAQASLIVRFNSAYGALPEPVRDGYVFDGWFYNGERITTQSIVRAIDDHELIAAWKPIKYGVAFDANGGTGEMGGIEVEYDSVTNLPLNVFRCPKMVFAGWATNATSEVVYLDGASISNVCTEAGAVQTLFAVWSPLVVASPVMTPGDGYVFRTDSCLVTLSSATDGATIYYSTNGTTPRTSAANAYNGPFAVSGAVTVIAVAVCDGVKSGYMTASLVKGAPLVPVIAPSDGHLFVGDSCEVTITCPTATATIYYTVDGSVPQRSETCRYTGPFSINKTTTVKAFAANDTFDSESVTATITKWTLTLAEAVGAPALVFSTGGDAEWTPIADETATSGYSAKSGAIGDAEPGAESVTWLETSVSGSGSFSFQWKVSCEHDDFGDCTWDRLMVFTNGVEVARIDGESGWRSVNLRFDDVGAHTIRWAFIKDDFNEEQFPDIAWVSGVVWAPDGGGDVDPIPEISSDAEVASALAGSADEVRLRAHLTGKTQYDLFRAWVDANGLEHQAVKNSPRAWFSYAIGANELVEKSFNNGDVSIRSLETTSTGAFLFEVDINSVVLGAAATAENLATVFGIQGAASLRESAFSSKNVNVTLGVATHGRLLVTAMPKQAGKVFFVRVKMHPDADLAVEEEIEHGKVQLWENGPYWAETNIGAENPEDYGYYFWWGDTIGYKRENGAWTASDGSSSNFSFEEANIPTYGKSVSTLQNEGWITADGVLLPEHDAAQVHWGGGWRMPTKQEMDDLVSRCDWTWATTNGVDGYIVRGRDSYASVKIFIPVAGYGSGTSTDNAVGRYGYYWSSAPYSDYNYSWVSTFGLGYHVMHYYDRYDGFPVRPVQGFNE